MKSLLSLALVAIRIRIESMSPERRKELIGKAKSVAKMAIEKKVLTRAYHSGMLRKVGLFTASLAAGALVVWLLTR